MDLPPEQQLYLANGSLNTTYLILNAETLLKSGEISLAKGMFLSVLKTGKLAHLSHFGLARCFEAEGDKERADSCYRQSLAVRPRYEIYFKYCAFLEKEGRTSEAQDILNQAMQMQGLSHVQQLELKKRFVNLNPTGL